MDHIPPRVATLLADALSERYTHNQLDALFRSIDPATPVVIGNKRDKCFQWLRLAGTKGHAGVAQALDALSRELLEGGPSALDPVDPAVEKANARIRDAISNVPEGHRMSTTGNTSDRVFISHASADVPLVNQLVDLLLTGIEGIQLRHIFCTSLEGTRIPDGVPFIDFIKGQLQDPALVIFVLTPSYWDSAFCLCELGAAWAMSHSAFPLLVPPLSYPDLQAVLSTVQARAIDDGMGLNALRDRLIDRLQLPAGNTGRWETKRDEFLARLPAILDQLPAGSRVPRSELEAAQTSLRAVEEQIRARDAELAKVRTERDAIASLKDAAVVRQTLAPTDEKSDFDDLIRLGRHRFRDLPVVVARVMLTELQGAKYHIPNNWEHETERAEARTAQRNDFLQIDDWGNVTLNRDDPKIRKCLEVLQATDEFFANASDAFIEKFEADNEMRTLTASERFWKKFLIPTM